MAAAGLVAAAVGVGALLVVAPRDKPEPGPLVTDLVRQGSGFPLDAGDSFTYAGITVLNPGPEPIVLEDVELVGAEPDVHLVGVMAAARPKGAFIVAYRDFPPSRRQYPSGIVDYPELEPIDGFVVPPRPSAHLGDEGDTQLYIGLGSVEPAGRVTLESFRIHYHVGLRRFEVVVPHSVAMCTPRSEYLNRKPCATFLPGEG